MLFFACFGSPSRRPESRPRGLKTPQERPKRLQEAFKSAPGGSKRASRHPESRSRGLKSLKTHPKRLQKTLRTLSIQTKHFEELQRCPARMPCHTMTTGHAESWRAGGGVPPKGKAIRRPQRSEEHGVLDQFSSWPSSQLTMAQSQLLVSRSSPRSLLPPLLGGSPWARAFRRTGPKRRTPALQIGVEICFVSLT